MLKSDSKLPFYQLMIMCKSSVRNVEKLEWLVLCLLVFWLNLLAPKGEMFSHIYTPPYPHTALTKVFCIFHFVPDLDILLNLFYILREHEYNFMLSSFYKAFIMCINWQLWNYLPLVLNKSKKIQNRCAFCT